MSKCVAEKILHIYSHESIPVISEKYIVDKLEAYDNIFMDMLKPFKDRENKRLSFEKKKI